MNNIWIDYLIRLLASLVCGFCLGIERKLRQHTVGIRTLTLICVSSCLLCVLAVYISDFKIVSGDPIRIPAAIVTGIGFLGAGAIVNQGLNIRGLTSAAIIFSAAALGICCGLGLYIPVIIVLIFTIFLLFVVGNIERKLFPAEKRKSIKIECDSTQIDEKSIRKIFTDYGIIIYDLNTVFSKESGKITLIYTGKTPDSIDTLSLSNKLAENNKILSISIEN